MCVVNYIAENRVSVDTASNTSNKKQHHYVGLLDINRQINIPCLLELLQEEINTADSYMYQI